MNKKIKKYFLFFIFIISLLAFGNEVPNEKVMDNPEREVTTVESMKTRDKATMSLTITKVNPIELDGTLENGKLTVKIPKKQTKMIIKSEDIKVKVEAIEKNPMLMKYNTKQILTSEDIRRILEEEGKRRKTLEKKYTIDKDSDENFVIMEISDVREEESKVNIAFFNNDNLMKAYSVPLKSPREDEYGYCPGIPYWSCINAGEHLSGSLLGGDPAVTSGDEKGEKSDGPYFPGLTQARITFQHHHALPTSMNNEILLKKIQVTNSNTTLKPLDKFGVISDLKGTLKLYPYMSISYDNFQSRYLDKRQNQLVRYKGSNHNYYESQFLINLENNNKPLFWDIPKYHDDWIEFHDRFEQKPQWIEGVKEKKCDMDFTLSAPSKYRLYVEDARSTSSNNFGANKVPGVYTTDFHITETFKWGNVGSKRRTRSYAWTVPLIDPKEHSVNITAKGNSVTIDPNTDNTPSATGLSFMDYSNSAIYRKSIQNKSVQIIRDREYDLGNCSITVTQTHGEYAKILVKAKNPNREEQLIVNFTLTQELRKENYPGSYITYQDTVLRTVNYTITFPTVKNIGNLNQEVDIRAYTQRMGKNADKWIKFNDNSYGNWNSQSIINNFIYHDPNKILSQGTLLQGIDQIILDNGTSTSLEIQSERDYFLGREGNKTNSQRITIPNNQWFDKIHTDNWLRVSPIEMQSNEITYKIVAVDKHSTYLSFDYHFALKKGPDRDFNPTDGYTGSATLDISNLTKDAEEEYSKDDFWSGNGKKTGKFSNQEGHFINPNGLITEKTTKNIMSHYKIGTSGSLIGKDQSTIIKDSNGTPAVKLTITDTGTLKVQKLSNGPMNLETEIIYLTNSNIGEIKLGKLTLTITNTGKIDGIGTLNQEVDIRAYDQLMQKNADKWIEFKSDSYGAWGKLTKMENFIGHNKNGFNNPNKLTTLTQIKLDNKELKIKINGDHFLGSETNGSNPQRVTIPKGVEFNKIDDQYSLRISPIDTKGENITYKIVAVDDQNTYHSFDYNLELKKGANDHFTSKEGYSGSATLNIDGVPVDGEEEYGNFVSRQLGKFENPQGHFINSKSLITGEDIITHFKITDPTENGKIEEVKEKGQYITVKDKDNVDAIQLTVTNTGTLKVKKLTSAPIDLKTEIIYLSEVGTNNNGTGGNQKVQLGKLTLTITSKGEEFELEDPKDLDFGSMIYTPDSYRHYASEIYKVKSSSPREIEFSVNSTATMKQITEGKEGAIINIEGINVKKLDNNSFKLEGTAVLTKDTPSGNYEGEIIVTVKIKKKNDKFLE